MPSTASTATRTAHHGPPASAVVRPDTALTPMPARWSFNVVLLAWWTCTTSMRLANDTLCDPEDRRNLHIHNLIHRLDSSPICTPPASPGLHVVSSLKVLCRTPIHRCGERDLCERGNSHESSQARSGCGVSVDACLPPYRRHSASRQASRCGRGWATGEIEGRRRPP
jgi:hypothetical protein